MLFKINVNRNFIFFLFITLLFYFNIVSAAPITTQPAYVWAENIGWINFNPTNGNVQVLDDKLTGYAWSQNNGWINLNPLNGGVKNTNGVLSGYAWGQGIGYMDFSGVTINTSTGQFSGTAIGNSVSGRIVFNCQNCSNVTTSWTPPSSGGGGGSSGILPTTTTPASTPTQITAQISVPLTIQVPKSTPTQPPSSPKPVSTTPPAEVSKIEEVSPEPSLTKEVATVETVVEVQKEHKTITEAVELNPDNVIGVANLSKELKIKIDKNRIFARVGDRVDIKRINNKITTVENISTKLFFRPDNPEKIDNIHGIIREVVKKETSSLLLKEAMADFSNTKGKVVEEFEYRDTDKDGVYVGVISNEYTPGDKYLVTNIVNYIDTSSEKVETDLEVLSQGYVYSGLFKKKRINNAEVAIYQLNKNKNEYEIWTNDVQSNPVITNEKGEYAFVVPVGSYYLTVKAAGFKPYKSDVINVTNEDVSTPINYQIKLKKELNTKSFIICLIIFIILLISLLIILFKRKFDQDNQVDVVGYNGRQY